MYIQAHHIRKKTITDVCLRVNYFEIYGDCVPNNFDFSPIKHQDLSCPDAQYPVAYSFKSFFVWKVQLL